MTGQAVNQVGFMAENERLLEIARLDGVEVRSFDDWKREGRWVKKGQKQKAVRVRSGQRRVGIDPITGEDRWEPHYKTAYGFTADQVN